MAWFLTSCKLSKDEPKTSDSFFSFSFFEKKSKTLLGLGTWYTKEILTNHITYPQLARNNRLEFEPGEVVGLTLDLELGHLHMPHQLHSMSLTKLNTPS